MNQEIKQQKQKESLKMFLENKSMNEICRTIHISHATYSKWRKLQNWDGYKQENEEKLRREIGADVFKEQERSLQLIHATEGIFAEKIQNREIEGFTVSSLAQLERTKQDIIMPRSETNLNFIKQSQLNVQIKHPEVLERIVKKLEKIKRNEI